MNVTKTNKPLNATMFVYAIVCCTYCTELVAHFQPWLATDHTYKRLILIIIGVGGFPVTS